MPSPSLADLPPPPPGRQGWPWTEAPAPPPVTDAPAWPVVGIVTPSYNQAQYIEATIRSVLLQGYPRLEYLILDGGSTDGTVAVLERYAPWLTYWVSEPDAGQADAIRRGWALSGGEYLGWLNSDDLLTPGSLWAAVQYLQGRPGLSGVYGDIVHIDGQGRAIGTETYTDFDLVDLVRRIGWISQPGSLFRRTALEAAGGLDGALRFLMDFDLWLRLGLVAPLGYLRGAPLAQFRRHPEAKSSAQRGLAAEEILRVVERFFARELPAPLRGAERQARANAHLYAGRAWSSAGDVPRALRSVWQALATWPRIAWGTGPAVACSHVALTAILGRDRAARWRHRRERSLRRVQGCRSDGRP